MNALIYLRVSTKEQAAKDETAEGYSIPAQREACARHCSDKGWSVADEFVDAGESARSAARPQLRAMLQRIAEGDIGAVVVHKIDASRETSRTTSRSARRFVSTDASWYRSVRTSRKRLRGSWSKASTR